MGIAVPFKEHNDHVQLAKDAIEDNINELLGNGRNGAVVAIITSISKQKFYEFLSYAKNNLNFGAIHKALKEKYPEEDIQMYAQPDLKWSEYKKLIK